MTPIERLRHDAFLDEVEETWDTHNYTPIARFRAFAAHCYARLFDGPPSLAQVAVAATALACGLTIQALAAPPANPLQDDGVPWYVGLALVFGVLGVAGECALSPRRVRPLSFAGIAAGPTGIFTIVYALTMQAALLNDRLLRAATLMSGIGLLIAAVGSLLRRARIFSAGLVVTSVAAALVSALTAVWCVPFARAHNVMWTIATFLNAFGAALGANGLMRGRPDFGRQRNLQVNVLS